MLRFSDRDHVDESLKPLPFDRYSRYNRTRSIEWANQFGKPLNLVIEPLDPTPLNYVIRFAQMSRREQLEQLLIAEPHDPFLRYGLAMCCASDGETDVAQTHFQQLLADHPDYVPGYFQFAQLLARLDEPDRAKPLLQSGIAVAIRTGDSHAAREMTEFLATL